MSAVRQVSLVAAVCLATLAPVVAQTASPVPPARGTSAVPVGGGGSTLPKLIDGIDQFTVALGQFEDGVELVGPLGPNLVKSTCASHSDGVYGTKALQLPPDGVVSMHSSKGFDVRQGTVEMWIRSGDASDFRRTLFSLQGTYSLDGDRFDDLVLGQANNGDPTWSEVWFGTANGLSPGSKARVRTFMPRGLSCGDVDGDGKPDLVVSQNQASAIHVFLGPLRPGIDYETPTDRDRVIPVPIPQGHALADIDGDGDLDLLVSSYASTSQPIYGFENDGHGKFTPLQFDFFGITGFAEGMSVGDVNRDGVLDVLFGSLDTTLPSVVFLGQIVAGHYSISVLDPAFYSIRSNGSLGAAIADVDADGWPDVLLARTYSNEVAIHLNHGDGTFDAFPDMTVPVTRPFTITATKDVDNDGYLDLAVASWKNGPQKSPRSSIFLGPDFSESLKFDVTDAVSFTLGDLDADGLLDVFWRSSTATSSPAYLLDVDGATRGTFSLPTLPTTPGTAGPGIGVYTSITGGTSPYATVLDDRNGFQLYLEGETLTFSVSDRNDRHHTVSVPFPEDAPSLDGWRHVQAEWSTLSGLLTLSVTPAPGGTASATLQEPKPIVVTSVNAIFRLGTDYDNQRACADCALDDVRISNVRRSTLP
ncbi:MAG: VCBS repeat-containing protein [Planctomycetes bacterium]|nr:VCBS repeat-containing protein [Planctomycetota bacterium]